VHDTVQLFATAMYYCG